ncbi:MAG: response regulator transcription factor [Hyphomicrobiaceae bacterium]
MTAKPHILVVDDQPAIRTLLRQALEAEGYTILEAASQATLMRLLESQPVDLITLDLNLGNDDGLEIARKVRASRNVPIVMITGRDAAEDRIVGFESGADDYIVKPFQMREVVLRIRSVLGRYGPLDTASVPAASHWKSDRYRIEAGVLDVPRRELRSSSGAQIVLTDIELDLLTILVRRPNRILSREELMQLLKGRHWSPDDRTIDKTIAHLRRKIEPPGEAPRLIKSVRTVGYVFTGNVEPL